MARGLNAYIYYISQKIHNNVKMNHMTSHVGILLYHENAKYVS